LLRLLEVDAGAAPHAALQGAVLVAGVHDVCVCVCACMCGVRVQCPCTGMQFRVCPCTRTYAYGCVALYVGLARTVCAHRIWPYIW
jgi:hypothetical protein